MTKGSSNNNISGQNPAKATLLLPPLKYFVSHQQIQSSQRSLMSVLFFFWKNVRKETYPHSQQLSYRASDQNLAINIL
jgi:hypothetical protein